jgi:2-amino-4-hydroxy-6-hydroxymethyldihydropteridine diphosphokinase
VNPSPRMAPAGVQDPGAPEATRVIVALGSNLGDRRAFIQDALRRLAVELEIEAVSRLVETPPWGPVPQGDFLNAVVRARTNLSPRALLDRLQAIEAASGRQRGVDQGPRTLDLDLVFHGSIVLDLPGLTVPHPGWRERPFVRNLLPEVAGDMIDPESGLSLAGVEPLPGELREVEPLEFPVPEAARSHPSLPERG